MHQLRFLWRCNFNSSVLFNSVRIQQYGGLASDDARPRNVVSGCLRVVPKRDCATVRKVAFVDEQKAQGLTIQDVVLPDFTESKNAYQSRSFLEVLRAYTVFRLCSVDFLVDNQIKILSSLHRLLGTRVFRGLMRRTLYGQFLAGDRDEVVVARARRERAHGILPMFAYTAKEVHGDVESGTSDEELEKLFRTNVTAIHNSIDIAAETAKNISVRPKATSKITFLALPQTLTRFNDLIRSNNAWLEEKQALGELQNVLAKLSGSLRNQSQDVLIQPRIGNEGIQEEDLESWKMNAAFHLQLAAMRNQELPADTMEKLITLIKWIDELGQHAASADVRLVWDAEQTYLQDAIDLLILDSMRRHNALVPTVTGTFQCYLKRTLGNVKKHMEIATREGICLGMKIVRGAYIVEEQRLAKEQNYEDPINPGYDATTEMYHSVLEFILQNVISGRVKTQTTIATHNLDTVKHIVKRMKALDITPNGNEIAFAQLVGMRDHITYPLGSVGLPASKLFHYGPVLEGVAYMSRRVQENRGGIGTANLERQMLGRELVRRMTLRG